MCFQNSKPDSDAFLGSVAFTRRVELERIDVFCRDWFRAFIIFFEFLFDQFCVLKLTYVIIQLLSIVELLLISSREKAKFVSKSLAKCFTQFFVAHIDDFVVQICSHFALCCYFCSVHRIDKDFDSLGGSDFDDEVICNDTPVRWLLIYIEKVVKGHVFLTGGIHEVLIRLDHVITCVFNRQRRRFIVILAYHVLSNITD